MKIRFNAIIPLFFKSTKKRYWVVCLIIIMSSSLGDLYYAVIQAKNPTVEPVKACIIPRDVTLTPFIRAAVAHCLGWQEITPSLCQGYYQSLPISLLAEDDQVRVSADQVSLYNEGRSQLSGNVEVQQNSRIVNAETAYVYREAKSNKVTKIELVGEVRYREEDKLMIGRKASINPLDKSGKVEDVLYRFNFQKHGAMLPAWGQARFIERFANKDYLLRRATYTTCAPQDNAWQIEADQINLDSTHAVGVARNTTLRIKDWPVFYSPYFSFPTSKARKSGFLMPVVGSSNVGGFDYAQPYYWNIAPNYDATFTPHIYSRRGVMLGGQFRYLTQQSTGSFNGRILPKDHAFRRFIENNQLAYPQLAGLSTNRWEVLLFDSTYLTPNLHFGLNYQQVSDDYFLQDFSSNLAILTERQLLRQGDLTYTTPNWIFRGMLQSYQTLHPINETPIADAYQRFPQLRAQGTYDNLPLNGNLRILGQYDEFRLPNRDSQIIPNLQAQGPRYYLNPALSLPQMRPWGYVTPAIEFVGSQYQVRNVGYPWNNQFSRNLPRYWLDSGLFFERPEQIANKKYTQTLEPRLYYLNVPYHNQSFIPVYDSGYMIFNYDQLFRNNRFSGFDRIGDANQFAYGLTSRWLTDETGDEKASFSIGQIHYFSDRKVLLCYSPNGLCVENPLTLGYLSPSTKWSPIATRGVYRINPVWGMTADYVWDPHTRSTNNGHIDIHYHTGINQILSLGYTYLVNGDLTKVAYSGLQTNPLHQGTVAFAWPFSTNWSALGAYQYNISKRYEMLSFLGLQYDSCCWTVRLMGGRTFQQLGPQLQPRYNNNVYVQLLLKGLGSVSTSDPASTIHTYIPGYVDSFHN